MGKCHSWKSELNKKITYNESKDGKKTKEGGGEEAK
jgi:hypothetical protein